MRHRKFAPHSRPCMPKMGVPTAIPSAIVTDSTGWTSEHVSQARLIGWQLSAWTPDARHRGRSIAAAQLLEALMDGAQGHAIAGGHDHDVRSAARQLIADLKGGRLCGLERGRIVAAVAIVPADLAPRCDR